MNEQQPTDQPIPAQPEPTHLRRRRPRLLAADTATALVVGVGGLGAGLAIAHQASAGAATGHASSSQQGAAYGRGAGNWQSGGQSSGQSNGQSQTWTDPGVTAPYLGNGATSTGSTGTRATATQLKGLVRVDTTLGYENGEAAGTGMILTSTGEVVTNHHVVAGATSIRVTVMSTGTSYTAKVVGTDTKDDVAVLQLADATGLSTVSTDTSALAVGDRVTAVGDADGTAGYLSAAAGRVLAVDQKITTQSEESVSGERLTGLVEVSSDVIAGDSGGATYDAQGDVVAMTTAASSGDADVVGYAIPIVKVLRIAGDLESGATSRRYSYANPAFLGIGLGTSSATVQGVYRGTPAARAGLAAGDTITAVDGSSVGTSAAVRRAIAAHAPGDTVRLGWTDSAGGSHSATVTLTTGPVA